VLNPDLLNSFIGHPIELRPAAGKDAVRDKQTTAVRGGTRLVAAAVTGVTERLQLRLETNDVRIMDFKDRAVYAEVNSSLVLLRVQGMLEVLGGDPPPTVCVLTPFDHPGAIERRQWVRVRTELPVGIERRGRTDEDEGPIRTATVDLSGGGIKLRASFVGKVGSRITLALELPSGPVEVEAEVLELGRNGMIRLQFLNMTESVRKRVFRHVFDVQRKLRKPAP
jgi:hypothetical protein